MSQDEYARRAARVAAAQLAEAAGFDRVQSSSLDILSDLLLRYIAEVGTASHAYAELANRTDANPLDVVSCARSLLALL
jgi:histone H3/H4